jgi:hypothetical protein
MKEAGRAATPLSAHERADLKVMLGTLTNFERVGHLTEQRIHNFLAARRDDRAPRPDGAIDRMSCRARSARSVSFSVTLSGRSPVACSSRTDTIEAVSVTPSTIGMSFRRSHPARVSARD